MLNIPCPSPQHPQTYCTSHRNQFLHKTLPKHMHTSSDMQHNVCSAHTAQHPSCAHEYACCRHSNLLCARRCAVTSHTRPNRKSSLRTHSLHTRQSGLRNLRGAAQPKQWHGGLDSATLPMQCSDPGWASRLSMTSLRRSPTITVAWPAGSASCNVLP